MIFKQNMEGIGLKMNRYRVLKEFFVYAKDEYEAEQKSENDKLKLPWILIDVQEMKGEDEEV